MTATVDERLALLAAGLSAVQINLLAFYRWRLYQHGYAGNALMTPDVLRQRRI